MPTDRVLLVHNSPRVGLYFSRLQAGVEGPEFLRCRVGVSRSRGRPPEGTIDEIVDYGMRRKRARPHYGSLRIALDERLYRTAARLHYAHVAAQIERHAPDAVGVWGGNAVDAKAVVVAARDADVRCFRFENGFLPNTTQMDPRGVNVESSVPRDPEFYAARPETRKRELPETIVPRPPKRGGGRAPAIELPERYVFVPFQVKLDSQILLHSPWITSMADLFRIVTQAAGMISGGPVQLVFKEHPSCPIRYPDLHVQAERRPNVRFAGGNPTDQLIRNALGVITINSTVGTESLLLGKPVLALGNAVYEVPGVASSARATTDVAEWLERVWADRSPEAPLREAFVRYLMDDYLIPDRHQDPGPAHFEAVGERFAGA